MLPKLLHNKCCHAMDTVHCPDSGLMPSDEALSVRAVEHCCDKTYAFHFHINQIYIYLNNATYASARENNI